MRQVHKDKFATCYCDMYSHPHRIGSTRCGGVEVPGLGRLRIPWPIPVDEYLGEEGRRAQARALAGIGREPGEDDVEYEPDDDAPPSSEVPF